MAEGNSVRQNLLDRLLHSVKQCQIHFGARQEMATESDLRVSALCSEWEAVLLHGMRRPKAKPTLRIGKTESICSLWPIARLCLSAEEERRFQALERVTGDLGRGRAWLRAAINERTLENYLLILLAEETKTLPLYEPHAFMLDQERASMLPVMAAGLSSILFSIPVDAEYLNSSQRTVEAPVLSPHLLPTTSQGPSSTPALLNQPHDLSHHDNDDAIVAVSAKEKKKKRKRKSPTNTSRPDSPVSVEQADITVATLEVGGGSLQKGISQESLSSSTSRHSLNSTNEDGGAAPMFVALETGPMSHGLVSSETAAAVNATALVLSATSATTPTQTAALPDSMSAGDLREALLVLVRAKDELEDVNKRLQVELRESEGSRQQLLRELEQSNAELALLRDTHASQKQSLERENDLLREQLKKYVELVQAQRKESSARSTEHIANTVASKGDESSLDSADLQRTASPSTEHKLTEMAEMYGELMEMNERLHRDMADKDNVIAKLVASVRQTGAEVSVPTKLLPSTVARETKPLVEVWIPSVIKKGRGPDGHHVYQVLLKVGPEEWNVYRRYAEFREFHRQLLKHVPDANSFSFPPKRALGNKSSQVVDERKLRLQEYLRFVFKLCSVPGCCQPSASGKGAAAAAAAVKKQERGGGDPLIKASTTKAALVNMFPFFREDQDTGSQQAPAPTTPLYSGL